MKSFNGLILAALVLAASFITGCTGVNNWWEREHALKPLKEQYWNGELSWSEYREKKAALVKRLEKADYMTPDEVRVALRNQLDDLKTNEPAMERMKEKESDEMILDQDEKMIEETETESFVYDESKPSGSSSIDHDKLSRSIKLQKTTSSTTAAMPIKPMRTAPVSDGDEMITDSKDVKWTRNHDGTVTYQDPQMDALEEPTVKPGTAPMPPAEVKEVPVAPTAPSIPEDPAAEVDEVTEEVMAKEEPEPTPQEPVTLDLGDVTPPSEDNK